jgi:hypothetical protein
MEVAIMNEVERLRNRLHERFPTPLWRWIHAGPIRQQWLDVELQGHHVAIEWRSESEESAITTASGDDYDSGAGEIYTSESADSIV